MSQSRVVIRPATSGDAAAIARMAAALLAHEGKSQSPLSARHVRRDGFGRNPAFSVLVAERGGKPVGYALYHAAYDPDSASRGVLVADLYVAAGARRSGIGRALLAAVARACRRRGGKWLFWFVLPRNRSARAFYRRLGAQRLETIPMALEGAGFDALMRRTSRRSRRVGTQ